MFLKSGSLVPYVLQFSEQVLMLPLWQIMTHLCGVVGTLSSMSAKISLKVSLLAMGGLIRLGT